MSFFDRVRDLLRKRGEPVLTLDTEGVAVVAEAFDVAEADSAVLGRSHLWRPDEPAILRHHLVLPPHRVTEAASVLAQDGWELRPDGDEPGRVHALRVQKLDALHCAQERARMAGLAQRLDGDWLGWDALQPMGLGGTGQDG
ncbi:hypothetical protein [Amycolatopsis thermophila]|uniref:Uncharacterized protein n=1 Tax=Amycolatopsis thermophila TaxID=206084 RepID=A0ABU0EX27_9PSEU|nr:hypothetical protein [Amycolatopsis thermophila]MDQ0379875.1 hypothetical protein [Amycolatopsis thermophila]